MFSPSSCGAIQRACVVPSALLRSAWPLSACLGIRCVRCVGCAASAAGVRVCARACALARLRACARAC
eukprot:11561806-Alexandrium_andersonii.AAC.1